MADAAAAAAEEAQRSVELSKLPLFYADKEKDQFNPDQWLERFEKARNAGNWSPAKTSSYFYNSLRSYALQWYRGLKIFRVDKDDWEQVRASFLENFGSRATSRLVITDFNNLKQAKVETVQRFASRLADIMYNYEERMPVDDLIGDVPETTGNADPCAQYYALPVAVQQEMHRRSCMLYQENNLAYMGVQFFVAGLHPEIQLEVIKDGTIDLSEAFKVAHKFETAMLNKDKAGPSKINELDTIEDPEEKAEIEAIRRQHQQKRMFQANNGSAYQNRTTNGASYSNNSNNGSNVNNGGGTSSNNGQRKPNPAFGKTCHYCKKKNHFQSDCYKRKRDNAPPVTTVKEVRINDEPIESVFVSKN